MPNQLFLPRREASLLLTTDAVETGELASLRTAIAHGHLTRIRRGVSLESATWTALEDDERYLARIAAVHHTRADAVFSGLSAAALHGLPAIDDWPVEVHVLSNTAGGKRRNGVVEHARRGDEVVVRSGAFTMTSAAVTVIECARTLPFAAAVACADAAIHVARFGHARPLTTHDELLAAYERRLPFPGSRRVLKVLEFMSQDADSPLESFSRAVIHLEGFPAPTLQHRVWLPRSFRWVYLDFAWLAYAAFGEADGHGKYLGNTAIGSRDPGRVVLAEKHREDEVRAATRFGVGRWDWSDARRSGGIRTILLEQGLPIVRPRPRSTDSGVPRHR